MQFTQFLFQESNKKRLHLVFLLLLTLCNFIFIMYLLEMAYYNRPTIDDFGLRIMLRESGFVESVFRYYKEWTGRFAFTWLSMILTWLYEQTGSFVPYIAILIFSFFIVFYKGLLVSFKPLIINKQDYFLLANLAVFMFILVEKSNYAPDTFFWFCASIIYFGGILLPCLGAILLFSPSKNPFSFVLLAFLFVFVGSAVENMAFTYIVMLSGYLFILCLFFYKPNFSGLATYLIKLPTTRLHLLKVVLAWVISVISFVISVLAPGNQVRLRGLGITSFDLGSLLWEVRKNIPHFFHDILVSNFGYFYCLIFVMCYVGTHFRKKEGLNEERLAIRLFIAVPLFILLLLCCIIPSIYASRGIGPERSLTIIAFLLVVFVAYFAFQIGYATLFPKKIAFVLACFSLLTFGYDARFRLINEVYGLRIYAQEYDQQINYLLEMKAKKNKKAVELPPITYPPASVIRCPLSSDSTHWVNMDFAESLQLGFKVYLKPSSPTP